MKVENPNVITEQSSGLTSVTIENKAIHIKLKNSATLVITPKIEDGEIVFENVYLTGKEQKSIDKKREFIKKMNKEIEEIINGDSSSEDDEDDDSENSEENTDEENTEETE